MFERLLNVVDQSIIIGSFENAIKQIFVYRDGVPRRIGTGCIKEIKAIKFIFLNTSMKTCTFPSLNYVKSCAYNLHPFL